MRDLTRLRDRFLRDGLDVRLGHIASNLLRVHSWLQLGRDPQAEVEQLCETASMVEWMGDHASEDLVNIQRERCRRRRVWPLGPARSLLAFRAKQTSDRVLELSGLASSTQR